MPSPPRFASLPPHELAGARRTLYDAIVGGPRSSGPQLFALTDDEGRLLGPFATMLLAPEVGNAVQTVGAALRYRGVLPPLLRELAILMVAAREASGFEWHAHEPLAASVGATDNQLAAIRSGACPVVADEVVAAGIGLVGALLDGDVADDEWVRLVPVIGTEMVYELTALVGYYRLLALQLRVFRNDINPGADT